MDTLVDDVARILASPVPRSRALRLIGSAVVGGCLGLRPAPVAAAPGGFQAYANAIDRRIWSYLLFQEPNPRTRKQIFDAYQQAQRLRALFQRTGQIPQDPMVEVIVPGENTVELQARNVILFLPQVPDLTCRQLVIHKNDGAAGYMALVDANPAFWQGRNPNASFVAGEFTFPQKETLLNLEFDPLGLILIIGGALILAAAVAATYIQGCNQPPSPPPTPRGGLCRCQFNCTDTRTNTTFAYVGSGGCCNATEIALGSCAGKCSAAAGKLSTPTIPCTFAGAAGSSFCQPDPVC